MTVEIVENGSERRQATIWTMHHAALLAAFAMALLLSFLHVYNGETWIGADNDDAMRMVQIRDLLAGQGWFDVWQYRLGPEGGSSMHWSRLIDAPIAALILLFSIILPAAQAEQAAIFIWPLLVSVPVFLAMATAARRLGDEKAVLPMLLLVVFALFQFGKFAPGSIDHHNVQLALMAILFAAMLDRRLSAGSFAVAGIAAATAIAIGAETLPLVTVVCAWVALLWVIYGSFARPAVQAYCLAFCLTLAAIFFVAVPPSQYGLVQCDAYSTGFYMLGTLGAAILFLTVSLFSADRPRGRIALLCIAGVLIVGLAAWIAPQCLKSEIYVIDPLLRRLWLDNVQEAHSVIAFAMNKPAQLANFYAVPLVAAITSLFWITHKERSPQMIATAFLLGCAYIIAMFQVRGSVFAMLFACAPMAVLIARMREAATGLNASTFDQVKYVGSILISIPLVWSASASGIEALASPKPAKEEVTDSVAMKCNSRQSMETLAGLPKGRVASISNLGAWVLLYSPHEALSAPYHRSHMAMLDAVKIGISDPATSRKIIERQTIDYLLYCPDNTETEILAEEAPEGLYSLLGQGQVPEWLEPVKTGKDLPLTIFRVVR